MELGFRKLSFPFGESEVHRSGQLFYDPFSLARLKGSRLLWALPAGRVRGRRLALAAHPFNIPENRSPFRETKAAIPMSISNSEAPGRQR